MTLKRALVSELVAIVANDNTCRQVICKDGYPEILKKLPAGLGMAGAFRNAGMQFYEWREGVAPSSSEDSGSPYAMDRICQGIANAVGAAFIKPIQRRSPLLNRIPAGIDLNNQPMQKVRNDTFFGHYANFLATPDGGEYIIDWWMTLEIQNPMVWKYESWRQYPICDYFNPLNISDPKSSIYRNGTAETGWFQGIPFNRFRGFP